MLYGFTKHIPGFGRGHVREVHEEKKLQVVLPKWSRTDYVIVVQVETHRIGTIPHPRRQVVMNLTATEF